MDFGEYIKNCIVIEKYNTKDFIKTDPIQFPRKLYDRGMDIKDIEISAIISSWLSYGSRKVFLPIIRALHEIMNWQPYEFINSRKFASFKGEDSTMYRFYSYNDFYRLCDNLYIYYFYMYNGRSIGDVLKTEDDPLLKLIHMFDNINGFPKNKKSACKRLCLLLRWMVRNDDIVDMGLWNLDKSKLIIPLDTHVHKTALKYGITNRKQANMKTAIEITNYFKENFPDDPSIGDFALYGLGLKETEKIFEL